MKLYDLIAKEADQETALRMLNAKGEVIGFYPRLAHAFGGVTHGLMLSQFMYSHGKETVRKGVLYPRHFSLSLKRTPAPFKPPPRQAPRETSGCASS